MKFNHINITTVYTAAILLLFSGFSTMQAQDNEDTLYLVFELMKVDNEQETAYAETEAFWKKIHQERVKAGDILGWDLWRLLPGGEDQGYQYMTVTLFNDPVKMMSGGGNLMANARKAYPKMSDQQLNAKLESSAKSRDLAVRIFLEQIATTEGDFEMKPGMVASMDLMKVDMGSYSDYESAEREIFQPMHQEQVDAGAKGSWELLRVMVPYGSNTYASHITVNMYSGWEQVFSGYSGSEPSFANEMMVQKGLETRDMKWSYMIVLTEMVR